MKVLVLGGTRFVGRHIVTAALAAGHEVTTFTRGQTNPDLFPRAEALRGDRVAGDLAALKDRRFDIAIDTCGYIPRVVAASASLLARSVEHYTFISSGSVYADGDTDRIDEHAPTHVLTDPTTEEVTPATYGGLKRLCEEAAEQALPGRVLHVRAGLLVGPQDPTDRFTWWPARSARGGTVLAPDNPRRQVQFLDARDLAAWLLHCATERITGTFNAIGPADPLTFGTFLSACGNAQPVWADEAFLLARDVRPFLDLPLWVPRSARGFAQMDSTRARNAGLVCRPIEQTIHDTRTWHETRADHTWQAGLLPEREAELLATWRAR